MTMPSLTVLVIAGALVGTGVYLLLERALSRVFIGLGLITHGVNVLILASGGAAGRPPLLGSENPADMADPLPQAMILTSIVLSLGTTAFGLALAYRSWKLSGHDEVVDDIEDRVLARRAEADESAAAVDVEAPTGAEDAGVDYDTADQEPAEEATEPASEAAAGAPGSGVAPGSADHGPGDQPRGGGV